jgi:heme/copper-type cytochrome/quinol oxidase subunit 2
MRNKKTVVFLYEPYECSALEEYFEVMAESGWLIKSISRPFLRFEKIEPKKLKFSVDILNKISSYDPDDSEDALDYREYCEAAGWKYVCQDKKIQVFYTEDYNSTIDIQTDEGEKFKSVVKASMKNVFSYILTVALWILLIWINLSRGDISYDITSNLMIATLVSICTGIIIYVSKIMSFIIWFFKAKKQVKDNKSMPYNNYKQVKIKNSLSIFYILIWLGLYCFLLIRDESKYEKGNSVLVTLMILAVIISVFIARYIRKKRYSRETNITLTISGAVVAIFIWLILAGISISIDDLNEDNINEIAKTKSKLTISDFGYKENESDFYGDYQKSILAEKVYYSSNDDVNSLSYTVLSSKYPRIVELQENRITEWVSRFEEDLKIRNTSLPSNIKVYSDEENEAYIFVTKNRVVDMHINISRIDKDEFLNVVYEKLLKGN